MTACLLENSYSHKNQLFNQEETFIESVRNFPNCIITNNSDKTGKEIYINGKPYAIIFNANSFCNYFLLHGNTHHELLPIRENCGNPLLFLTNQVLYVIELKFLGLKPNADEELAMIDYRKKQFIKLMAPHGIRVEYICVLSHAFKKPIYRDILEYLKSVNCLYSFNGLPSAWLGFGI